jgi:hypothetical protein
MNRDVDGQINFGGIISVHSFPDGSGQCISVRRNQSSLFAEVSSGDAGASFIVHGNTIEPMTNCDGDTRHITYGMERDLAEDKRLMINKKEHVA